MCDCIRTANKFLREHNGRVKEHMGFTGKMQLTECRLGTSEEPCLCGLSDWLKQYGELLKP